MKRFQQILQFIKNNQLVVIFFVLILIMMLSVIFSRQDKNNSPFVDGVVKEGNYVTSDYNITVDKDGKISVLVRDPKKADLETIRNDLSLSKDKEITFDVPGAATYIGDHEPVLDYEGDLSEVGN